jgi:hypothetical protein
MRFKLLCTFALIAVALASAQTKHTFSGKCAKPENVQSIPAGDKDGHVFMIQQGKCTTEKGEIAGVKSKEGTFSEHNDAGGTRNKAWGVFVETYDNGERFFTSIRAPQQQKVKHLWPVQTRGNSRKGPEK